MNVIIYTEINLLAYILIKEDFGLSIQTSAQETINALNVIFDKHKNERICVLATTCCGKTTLLKQIPDCVDLDDELLAEHCKKRGNNFADSKNV